MPPPAIARPDGLDIVLLVGSDCRLVNETLAAGDRDARAYWPVLDNPIAVRGSRIAPVARNRARPKRASPDDTVIVVPEVDRNAASVPRLVRAVQNDAVRQLLTAQRL